MDVKELPKRKEELEDRISDVVSALLKEFQEETGIQIEDVNVNTRFLVNPATSRRLDVVTTRITLDI